MMFISYVQNVGLTQRSDKENNVNPAQRALHFEQMRTVVGYCENKIDCRRMIVLRYFGENFDRSSCGTLSPRVIPLRG